MDLESTNRSGCKPYTLPRQQMWEPAHATALPTTQDRLNAILAIQTLEIDLKDAISQRTDAQLRIDAIEKNLNERKAWIAPVRKLSLDVLSLIFELCGEDDWETTLRIAAVSRQWRYLALSTPRAWSFIDLRECPNEGTIQTFFLRSGQRPLHIFLPDLERLTFLLNVAHRLQCLSIDTLDDDANKVTFPILTRLTIRSEGATIQLSDIGADRFPSLLHLVCESYFVSGVPAAIGDASYAIAPLQNLSLVMDNNLMWLDVLKLCKDTLVSLRLHLLYIPTTPFGTTLALPKLKCLHTQYWEEEPNMWPLNLVTNALEEYQELSEAPNTIPIHQDVRNVTVARLNRAPNLSIFPKLVTLQCENKSVLSDVLSQLLSEDRLCPELTLIEIGGLLELGDLDDRIVEINKRRKSKEITIFQGNLIPIAGIIEASPCGKEMPCSEEIF